MNTNQIPNEKNGFFYSVIKYFSTSDSEKISKNNRLTNSYIYGFEHIVSSSNHIINAALDKIERENEDTD